MFEELLEKLNECGQVRYKTGDCFIRIPPTTPAGFSLMIEWIWDTHFAVLLDGWRDDFDSYEDALICFISAASGGYRLKTSSKGSFRFRSVAEDWDGSRWVERSTTTEPFYPFWTRTTTSYLRNDLQCGGSPNLTAPAWRLTANHVARGKLDPLFDSSNS